MGSTIEPAGTGSPGADDAPVHLRHARLPRRSLKRSEEVARQIVRDIMDRQLSPGALVASETAMLEAYQVSRESLREALRLLETQGLVELRRGRGGGALVGAADASDLGRLATLYFQLDGATYDDLLEAWIFAESALAESAACNPDLKARRAAMDGFAMSSFEGVDGHPKRVLEDLAFHHVVSDLAANPVLRLLLASVRTVVAPHLIDHLGMKVIPHDSAEEHVAIARAIRGGYATRAKQLAADHTRRLVEACRTEIGERVHQSIDWL